MTRVGLLATRGCDVDKVDDLTKKAAGALMAGAGQVPAASAPLGDEAVQVVNLLFERLCAIKPAYRQAWPDDKALGKAKREWVRAFMAAGITTVEQLRFGLEACRADPSDFVPGPGKFIEWCTPEPTTKSVGSSRWSRSGWGCRAWTRPTSRHCATRTRRRLVASAGITRRCTTQRWPARARRC